MKTTKSNILSGLTYALSVIGCLSVASCADNGNYIEKDSSIKSESDNSKYDENNYSFNTTLIPQHYYKIFFLST